MSAYTDEERRLLGLDRPPESYEKKPKPKYGSQYSDEERELLGLNDQIDQEQEYVNARIANEPPPKKPSLAERTKSNIEDYGILGGTAQNIYEDMSTRGKALSVGVPKLMDFFAQSFGPLKPYTEEERPSSFTEQYENLIDYEPETFTEEALTELIPLLGGGKLIPGAKPGQSPTFVKGSTARGSRLIENLRRTGQYSEQDLTLIKNATNPRAVAERLAKGNTQSRRAFQKVHNSLQNDLQSVRNNGIGYKSSDQIKRESEKLYGQMLKSNGNTVINDTSRIQKTIQNEVANMKKMPLNDAEKKLLTFLEDAEKAIPDRKTADYYLNLHKKLNSTEFFEDKATRAIAKRLNKNITKQIGKSNKALAQELVTTDKAYRQSQQMIKSNDMLKPLTANGRVDYNALNKMLNKESSAKVLREGLGEGNFSRLQRISKSGRNLEGLYGRIEKDLNFYPAKVGAAYAFFKPLTQGKFNSFLSKAPKIAAVLGIAKGATRMTGNIATKFLTDPKYQHIIERVNKSLLNGDYNKLVPLMSEMERYMKETKVQSQAK